MNVRQAEKAACKAAEPVSEGLPGVAATENSEDVNVRAMVREMEQAMETSLGRKCLIQRANAGSGKMVTNFTTIEDLEGLVERLIRKFLDDNIYDLIPGVRDNWLC